MAPEILVRSQRLKPATFDDLKKIDIWVFGMVMFNLFNPDLKYPFQLDIKAGKITVKELLADKKLPTPSTKYDDLQNTVWSSVSLASAKCLQFDPSLRPSVSMLKDAFKSLIEAESTPSVSQGSSYCTGTVNEESKKDKVASTRCIPIHSTTV